MKHGLQCIIWTLEQCRQTMWYFHISQQICLQVQQVLQSQVENEHCLSDEWLQQSNSWMMNEKQLQEKLFWFLEFQQIHWHWRDDMKNVWLMIQLRQKWCETHHNHSQVEQEFQYMFQKLCWIEFRQDCNKWIALAILVCIMKQCKSILALWIIVMTGEMFYWKKKQKDVIEIVLCFEIEAIEIAWWVKTHFFVQIATIISRIWQFANELCWDLCELERRESMFKESSAICER